MTLSQNVRDENRPVRSFASQTPKWQRFQNKALAVSDGGNKKKLSSSSKSVKSTEKEITPYQRQYSHVYSYRLAALKDRCWQQLKQLSSESTKALEGEGSGGKIVNRILELQENELSNVVGTIIVESMNGNSDENYYDENVGEDRQIHRDVTCRSGDQLFLEDESGRVALHFVDDSDEMEKSFAYQFCTGVVAGVQGSVDERGMMHVRRIVTPILEPPIDSNGTTSKDDTPTPHLLLVSSLLCGDPEVNSLPREMLVSYLQGHFNNDASKVAKIIVAGSGPGVIDPAMGLREFDLWGLEVSRTAGIPLDILPSATDPTTRNWPQRPLHSSLLPNTLRTTGQAGSGKTSMARVTPNPYEALINEQLVLGTDGLNVRDLQKYILKPPISSPSNVGDNSDNEGEKLSLPQKLTELDALEQTLRWAHICPTGPNSANIGMVPSGDPMVMSKTAPNIYFSGNCEEGFATKLLDYNSDIGDTTMESDSGGSKTRLICIPKFSETGEAVLVNLKTLGVEVLRFSGNGNTDSN